MLKLEMKPEQLEILKAEILVSDTASNNYILGRGYLLEYQKLENIDAAIAAFKRALKEEPNYAVAYAGLGEAYLKKYNLTDDNYGMGDFIGVFPVNAGQSQCRKPLG